MLTSHLRRTISTSFRCSSPTLHFFSSPARGAVVEKAAAAKQPQSFLSTATNGSGDDDKLTAKVPVPTPRFISSSAINDASKAVEDCEEEVTSSFIAAVTDKDGEKAAEEGVGDKEVAAREKETISIGEMKKLMRLVNVEELKMKLGGEGKEVISYGELLKACEGYGVAKSVEEAVEFAEVLDDAGVILLFRDKVYLHPHKVVELVSSSVPLALTPEDDPRREELKKLQERKEKIDTEAHKQVRVILWSGLGIAVMQVGLFFRLTFWEFSWDVMEPVAFFMGATGLVIGYGYFMITSRDPTYQDLMKRLFLSRQRKLLKKYQFDIARFKELTDKCRCPSDKKHSGDNLVL